MYYKRQVHTNCKPHSIHNSRTVTEGMVGTPDPHHKLHEYMDGDDVGWPNLSRFGWETKPIWAYFIVILFI